ncbi:MAG: GlsB/YeaQ/YmgE family stress response membrane protein, partial [Bacillota bacterium]
YISPTRWPCRFTLEDAMNILWTLIIGLVVGAIAKFLMPGRDPGGIFITMLLGVAGAFLAGFLGRSLGWYSTAGSGPGIIASIIGAMILLFIYRLFVGRRGTTVP